MGGAKKTVLVRRKKSNANNLASDQLDTISDTMSSRVVMTPEGHSAATDGRGAVLDARSAAPPPPVSCVTMTPTEAAAVSASLAADEEAEAQAEQSSPALAKVVALMPRATAPAMAPAPATT